MAFCYVCRESIVGMGWQGMSSKASGLTIAVAGIEAAEAGGAHIAENLMLSQIRDALVGDELVILASDEKSWVATRAFRRLTNFFGNFRAIWRSQPVYWFIVRRFARLALTSFERDLLRKNVDLVFFVGPYDKALELKRIPYVATIWDLGHRDLPALPELVANREFEYREWRIRDIAVKALAVIVDSEPTKEKLQTYYGIDASRILVLPFPPNPSGTLHVSHRDSFALYPAHFWSHKNHIVLLQAIALLVGEGKQPRKLKLTGLDRGNLKYLLRRIDELGISEHIDFLGFLSETDLHALYQSAAIVVMPSMLGPTNLPPLEALLRGCPVAVARGARANLGDWQGVIELDAMDIAAWARILDQVSEFPKVQPDEIEGHLLATKRSNVVKLQSLFAELRVMKNTYSFKD